MAWHDITGVKLVQRVIEKENGDKIFYRMGVRVTLAEGSTWFYHFKFDSWTRKEQGDILTYRSGSPIIENGIVQRGPEKKQRYSGDLREIAHCKVLLDKLLPLRTYF